jgi:hypothetical protein
MTRLALIGLLSAFAVSAVAAPVPKGKQKDDTVDLRKLHDRIAEAVSKDNWSDDDTTMVEEKVTALLAKMTSAAEVEERKLPVGFKGLKTIAPADVRVVARNALIIGEDVKATSFSNCVIVASGAVQATGLSHCIVIARTVRCTSADNTVVVADEHARATGWGSPKSGDCVVVAGKRIRATGIHGGMFHVVAPDFTCNVDDGRANPKDLRPVMMTRGTSATFLVDASAAAMGEKDCKRVELKAPIAK